ncbi:MAG: hypothetical protein M3Z66_13195 [Chloroflexota bacterium]|nr:hypothetical protein [Chloroflexota bacterium]
MDDFAEFVAVGLPALLRSVQGSDICELDVQDDDLRVRLRRGNHIVDSPRPVMGEETEIAPIMSPPTTDIVASVVGTFYRAGHASVAPLVAEGSQVEDDTVVGIIEALQVLTEVEAGCTGLITTVLATDGQPVDYGQPLFTVMLGG